MDYPWLNDLHVKYKEAICVVLAAYRWAPAWQKRTVIVRCDNIAAVTMPNKGSTKNPHILTFLREFFWLSALFNFRLKAYYISGSFDVKADHMSPLHESSHFLAYCCILKKRLIDIFYLPI